MFEGRAAIGYDHGYDAQKFYLGLTLDLRYAEGYLNWICKDDNGEDVLRGVWEVGDDRDYFLEPLKSGCEVRSLGGQPPGGS